eukprot:TRINITY_DN10214_c0_g1_i1.p1 TRINITY_DN10214_c0_g1~~TRINITY_DN10214_c0_g1_i1.p1  ORF type:complete len:826 (-),score=307.39 TRINITY_DN10214_c0_g1_i1:793-3270(-)
MINTNIYSMVRENVDLVVCVETTAMAGIGIKALKSDYLLPALEHFSGSSLGEADFCQLEQSSSYTLIPFKNANCFPEPSYRVFGPYTSPKKFLDTFDKLEFTGGGGESFNLGQEALAASLKVYEKLSNLRDADYKGLKHIIYIANCPMYDIPVMECTQFAGKSIESLCAVIKERHVSLSIFCARKVPFLLKLYENAGGDMMQAKEKNFAKDAKHMILLKNLALEERPVTPRAASQSPAPGVKTGNMQQNYPFNQNQQQNQQQSQMNTMQQQFMNQQNQNVAGAGKLANALTNPPQTSQPQDNTTLKNLLDRKPNPIQQNPGGAWQYQSVRGQMNPRMTGPGGMGGGMMPGGHGMATQGMGGVVMSNMQGMQGMQGGPQSAAGGMMGNQGGGMVVGGHPQQQQQQQQGAMGQQQGGAGMSGPGRPVGPHHKEKQMIWAGEIEWKKKAGPNEQQIVHNVKCQVSSTLKNGQPEVLSDNWPTKLMMQLIPKQVIQNIGGHYFKDSKSVFFHPQESESLNLLSKEMSSGFAGYVQFGNCDIKVLILLYGSEKKSYLGFIPNDQNSFVERIMSIYRQGNMRQQQQQQAQQQQQQQMLNQQQNQGRGGMVSMQNASLIQQQQQGMMSQSMMGAAGGNQQQLAMSTASGGMMMTSAGQQQVISSQQGGTVPSTGAQMVMMPGGNMVRMQTTSNQQQSQQQFMRMQQQQQQQQNSQQQNRPMMHGTALRQILQHPGGGAGGPGMPVMGGRGGGMQPGGGGMMMGAGRMTGPMVGNAGGMMGGGQPNQQGMMGGQQGNMMGGGQPNQQGGMMGGGQQQQGGENSLRDLLSNRDV